MENAPCTRSRPLSLLAAVALLTVAASAASQILSKAGNPSTSGLTRLPCRL